MSTGTPPHGRTGPYTAPLPPRAEREVQQGLSVCLTWLDLPLREALVDADRSLFDAAEHSRNHLDQQACFEARNVIEREGAAFRNRFAAHLSGRFRHLAETATKADDGGARRASPLSLVDPGQQELDDALSGMAARSEAHGAGELFELGYRLAVLAGTPPLEGDALPPGPRALVRALATAAEPMPLGTVHRLLLFQAVDACVLGRSEALYEALNAHYRAHGILPGFRAWPAARVAPDVSGRARGHAAVTEPTASTPASTTDGHIGVLEDLRKLLAMRVDTGRGSGFAPGRLASDDELQTALLALQGHVDDIAHAARREIRSAKALRSELLAQLDHGRPTGSPPAALTAEQDDTLELTARLFENLGQQVAVEGPGRGVLGGLQWPMLRAAVDDRGFFDQPTHPARQLLDTVSEAARNWLDPADGEPDTALVDRLERLVVDASEAQVIDPAWRAGIERQVAFLARKAHVSERRQVEAMEGRDRLECARRRAQRIMAARAGEQPNTRGVLRILLERTWTDVLALHILRGGENGEAFLHCLGVTEQLLGRRPVTDARQLRIDVERGLEHLGMHPGEAAQVVAGLFQPPPEPGNEALSTTDVAMRLKRRPRLGEGTAHGETPAPVRPVPLDAAARAVHARFADLRFGTWFEFRRPGGGYRRQKLAWFSPTTGHCLFVTQRGARGDDMDLTRLARLVARGDARECPPNNASLVDRAWQAIAGRLRHEHERGTPTAGHA